MTKKIDQFLRLLICGGIVLGQGAKVLCGIAQGFIHVLKEVEDVKQQEQQGDKREDEEGDEVKGEVEEIRSNVHYMHG